MGPHKNFGGPRTSRWIGLKQYLRSIALFLKKDSQLFFRLGKGVNDKKKMMRTTAVDEKSVHE